MGIRCNFDDCASTAIINVHVLKAEHDGGVLVVIAKPGLPEGWTVGWDKSIYCPDHQPSDTECRQLSLVDIKKRAEEALQNGHDNRWARRYYEDVNALLNILRCHEGYGGL